MPSSGPHNVPLPGYPPYAAPPAKPHWWRGLSGGAQVVVVFAAVLALCIGGATIAAAAGGHRTSTTDGADRSTQVSVTDGPTDPSSASPSASVPSSASPSPVAPSSDSPSPVATPSIAQQTVTETEAIPYSSTRVNDPTLAKGTTKVRTRGVAGVRTLTYNVTLTDGVQTSKVLVSSQVTKQPVTEVIAVGTKQATSKCDPNYSGACVPIASDVDCAGGGGNGPAYVKGPVYVIGKDIYGLDSDGDGVGCEN